MARKKKTSQEEVEAIHAALALMIDAEWNWDELPPSIRTLDRDAVWWIAAALASEGIGKLD